MGAGPFTRRAAHFTLLPVEPLRSITLADPYSRQKCELLCRGGFEMAGSIFSQILEWKLGIQPLFRNVNGWPELNIVQIYFFEGRRRGGEA